MIVRMVTALLSISFVFSYGLFAQSNLKSRIQIEQEKAERSYQERRSKGLSGLNSQYLKLLKQEQETFFAAGDTASVRVVQDLIADLESENKFFAETIQIQSGRAPSTITIQALVDGSDELRVTESGMYWVSYGAAKVGRHQGRDEATYINGEAWSPHWDENRKDRGRDASSSFRMIAAPGLLKFQMLAISSDRNANTIEERAGYSASFDPEDEHFVVNLPDGEGGSRWYTFRLYYETPFKFPESEERDSVSPVSKQYFSARAAGISKVNEAYLQNLAGIREAYIKERNLSMSERTEALIERLNAENAILAPWALSEP